MPFIQKITEPVIAVAPFSSFTVLGDPGCDGLGAEILALYAQGMRRAKGDLLLIAGDLVPEGREEFYRQTDQLIERTARVPVYLLRGNHDTGAYAEHYGLSAYALHDDETLLVVLDNSLGRFTPESLAVLEHAVREVSFRSLILAMHIPPPNGVTKKAVSAAEWEKVRAVLCAADASERLCCCIAGHVHSYFEDGIDGAATIVTGGAGARIAPMEGVPTPYNHYVEFRRSGTHWLHEKIDLSFAGTPSPEDPELIRLLQSMFAEECMAAVRYSLLAEDAWERGMPSLSGLYRAISRSEYYHARSHYYVAGRMEDPLDALRRGALQEHREATTSYPLAEAFAETAGDGLCAASFADARAAEETHLRLLLAAQNSLEHGHDLPEEKRYVCTSCGAVFTGGHPARCPVCGAPADKIEEVS